MVTDDERREVARRLRGQAKKLGPNMDAHEFAHYTADVLDVGESMTWCEMELRLADLIEPSDMSQGCSDIVACDRDALLELADEIEDNDVTYCVSSQYVLDSYARRIREALGVTDG